MDFIHAPYVKFLQIASHLYTYIHISMHRRGWGLTMKWRASVKNKIYVHSQLVLSHSDVSW